MSQRVSGYSRIERDVYETPAWVTRALLPHVPDYVSFVWEPAGGGGKMVDVLREFRFVDVVHTDIATGDDFLKSRTNRFDAVITNPPYNMATKFIEHALTQVHFVAMLLRTDFDHAKTRRHLFADNPNFSKKIVLTKRIRWFEDSTGSPSFNHSWFIWDKFDGSTPTIHYDFQD
jgi:hypothetical protein